MSHGSATSERSRGIAPCHSAGRHMIVQGTIHKWVVIVEVRAFQLGRLEGV